MLVLQIFLHPKKCICLRYLAKFVPSIMYTITSIMYTITYSGYMHAEFVHQTNISCSNDIVGRAAFFLSPLFTILLG